ncbi:molybdate transport system ATP-binding protein [Zhongshania antarctica]|uniref:Molybdate transport system ATP-binding protein n=1 Tax=Zhongshania antarctica TaxID=641702 RepID=A0A840R7V3_9GAMM|nr:molybdenum ABC transporter ATP-binding protein [Zhongshania antarctica]MBB5188598.1 molybdate transport system ATP-binding protein [Zhongshania antarctica]
MSLLLSLHLQRGDFRLDIDTALPSTGITAICGPSGSGKTSLLRCIAGLDRAPDGMVQFLGSDWQSQALFLQCEKRGVGLVFQDAQLFPHLSVAANLGYAEKRQFRSIGPNVEEVCNWLQITALLNRDVNKLSGGERKRVAIARALLRHPQLLLMDEPLSGLHDAARDEMMDVLQSLPQHLSLPIIYVSHSFHEVSRLADHVVLLDNGQLIAEGDLVELSSRLDLPLSRQQDAGAVLNATLLGHDHEYQLSTLQLNTDQQLSINQISAALGQQLRLFVAARDISISLEAPTQSSILNSLKCTIDTIDGDIARNKAMNPQVTVRLSVGDQYLLARITRKSRDRLNLHAGQQVFAQIKTVALVNETGVAS